MKMILLKRWLIPLLGGAAAVLVVSFVYRGFDTERFFGGLREANFGWILMLGATILLEQILNGWKWRELLYEVKPISSLRLTGALLAGFGANMLVPIGISPLVRSWLIARLEGLSMATVLVTTVIARFIDGVVFALFAGFVAVAGSLPQVEGRLQIGFGIAGALNLGLFGALLWLIYRARKHLGRDAALVSRLVDWIGARFRQSPGSLRAALAGGVVWPRQPSRRLSIFAAAFAAKATAATHFLWAGLAVGVTLGFFDYLFLMVFAGFSLVLSRFVRVPGGFIVGSVFALSLLGVADEPALLMILFSHTLSILIVVGVGGVILWRSGVDIREMKANAGGAGV